jgi:hypothetical protein
MSHRFDYRSIDTFKKQIKFSTQLEKYFFQKWLDVCDNLPHITVQNPRNNGVDNDGEFVAAGVTSGADYMVDLVYGKKRYSDVPIEIKWVPTFGKLTLKVGDLKAYIREGAAILFIYTKSSQVDLRLPKDYDLEKHINKIESVQNDLCWGIMTPDKVKVFLSQAKENGLIQNVHYMGGKPGIVLNQDEFHKWFKQEKWQ